MSELSSEARALFRAARRVDQPPPDAQDRVRNALQAKLALEATGAASQRAWFTGAAGKYLVAAIMALATAWEAAALSSRVPSPAVVQHAPAPRAISTRLADVTPQPPLRSEEGVPKSEAPPPPSLVRERVAVRSARRVEAPARSVTAPIAVTPPAAPQETAALRLAEEIRLVSAAREALRSGDGARSLATLDDHRQRFPDGVLTTEASAVRVLALCALGRTAEARVLARSWLATSGRSPLASGLRHSCAVDDE